MKSKTMMGAISVACLTLSLTLALTLPQVALANEHDTFSGLYVGVGGTSQFNGETSNNAPNPIDFGFSASGGYASILAGYRVQTGSLVFGAELDGNFGSAEDISRVSEPDFVYDGQVGIGNLTSLRAQLGFTPSENTLLFASVGGARVELAARLLVTSPFLGSNNPFVAIDARSTETGLIYGVGGEFAWNDHWRTRLEFNRLKVEEFQYRQANPFGPSRNDRAKIDSDMVRATINYQF